MALSRFAAARIAPGARAASSIPASLLNVPVTQVSKASNGMRVASEEGHGETATVGVYIDTGSRYENADNNGVAHFLEHMAFKGTDKRTQQDLELEIENIGGHLNAYTSREQTVYFAKVMKNDVAKAVEILGDILQNAKLEESAIERERGVILREMEEVNSQTDEVLMDHLHSVAYQGTPLARTILGPEENIKKISKKDLSDYIGTHYTSDRMVVAGAGAIDHDSLTAAVDKHFGSIPSTPKTGGKVETAPSQWTGADVRLFDDSRDTVSFALAVEGVGYNHPDYIPLMVAQSLVGSWDRASGGAQHMASRCAQVIADYNLALNMSSFNTCYSDTGLFGATGTAAPDAVEDLIYAIQQEWVRMCYGVTDRELERATNQLKTMFLTNLEGSTAVCEDIGRQVLCHGRRLSAAEIYARIDAVDEDTIKRVANDYIWKKSPSMAAVGPMIDMPDYQRLERWSYWMRS